MKRLLLLFAIFSLLFAACDNIFMKDIIERADSKKESGSQNETADLLPIPAVEITVLSPEKGESPDLEPSGEGDFFISVVSWSPDDNPFKGGTRYTVAITLTADKNYKFTGETTAAINGNSAAISVSDGGLTAVLSYEFAETLDKTLAKIFIDRQPDKLNYVHGDKLDLFGIVVFFEYEDDTFDEVPFVDFVSKNISTIPANGAVLSASAHNGAAVIVSIGSHSVNTDILMVGKANPFVAWPQGLTAFYGQKLSDVVLTDGSADVPGSFTWTMPANLVGDVGLQSHNITFTPDDTGNYNTLTSNVTVTVSTAPITNVAVTITGPVKGETPDTVAEGSGNFTIGAVSWLPNDSLFLGSTQYTAAVTLTANTNYTFTGLTAAYISGQAAEISNNTGTAVTLSFTFAATDTRGITGISIKTPPELNYTHGDELDLSALVAELTYDDSMKEDVPFAIFVSKNISVNLKNSTPLSASAHNGIVVTVSIGNHSVNAGNLTVSTKALTVTDAVHTKQYDGTMNANGVTVTLSGIVGGDNVSAGTVTAVYTSADAGTKTINITAVTLTGADAANYTVTMPANNVSVTEGITKTAGAGVDQLTVTGNATNLSVTVSATLAGSTGQSVEYAHNTTNSAPVAGWQNSGIFTLTANAEYYVFARSASNNNYNVGAPSAGVQAAFYTVTFDKNGGDTNANPASRDVFINGVVTAPTAPTKTGYDFTGWYKEAACENEWGFAAETVTDKITLYAGWEPNTAGITISIEEIKDGASTFSFGAITLSKNNNGGNSSTQTISIQGNSGDYGSIEWKVAGVGAYSGQFETGSGASFILDANNEKYGTLGGHSLMLTVNIDGNPYMVNIRFTIED